MKALAHRWTGEADRYWWRFTYANENLPGGRGRNERRQFGIVLSSGGHDDDDGVGCSLRMHLLGRTLIVALPAIIRPFRSWVDTSMYEWSRDQPSPKGYWQFDERSYGFMFVMSAVHVYLGRHTGHSETDRSKVYFLPWRAWRHIRYSLYDLDGAHVWSQFDRDKKSNSALGLQGVLSWFDVQRVAEDAAPKMTVEFLDFDKERLSATLQINEREWALGEGQFKWLSWFAPNKVKRSLDIRFSDETGRRKGSWKGGTMGHSIDMLPGELHDAAFRRYAAAHDMTYPIPHFDAIKVEGTRRCITDSHLATGMQSGTSPAMMKSEMNKDFRDTAQDVAPGDDRSDSDWPVGRGFLLALALALILWALLFAMGRG